MIFAIEMIFIIGIKYQMSTPEKSKLDYIKNISRYLYCYI